MEEGYFLGGHSGNEILLASKRTLSSLLRRSGVLLETVVLRFHVALQALEELGKNTKAKALCILSELSP